jgi:hypothetical protein
MLHSSRGQDTGFSTRKRGFDSPMQHHYGPVAQLENAPDYESGRSGFESSRDRHTPLSFNG